MHTYPACNCNHQAVCRRAGQTLLGFSLNLMAEMVLLVKIEHCCPLTFASAAAGLNHQGWIDSETNGEGGGRCTWGEGGISHFPLGNWWAAAQVKILNKDVLQVQNAMML